MSTVIWWMILGLLIGWLIEWVIDWIYWRRRRPDAQLDTDRLQQASAEQARLRDALASARAENERIQAELSATTEVAQRRQVEIDRLEQRLASMRAGAPEPQVELEPPKTQFVTTVPSAAYGNGAAANLAIAQPLEQKVTLAAALPDQPAERQRDPLIDINGIGPVFEQRLFDAGVYTFAELAALTPEQVRAIIAPQHWQQIEPEAWIAEARLLAQKKA